MAKNNTMGNSAAGSAAVVNPEMARRYPVNEYLPLVVMINRDWPGLNPVTVSVWCREGKYPYAIKRGKHWMIHPVQFKQWFTDVGPESLG